MVRDHLFQTDQSPVIWFAPEVSECSQTNPNKFNPGAFTTPGLVLAVDQVGYDKLCFASGMNKAVAAFLEDKSLV